MHIHTISSYIHTYTDPIKVNLPLCLVKSHAIQMYGDVEIQLYTFLSSELDEARCQLHAPGTLKEFPVSIGWETEWALGPVGNQTPDY
jgi:hypothetical protein